MDLAKLTEGIAELKKIMESLASADKPVAEHQEEVSKLGDSKLLIGIADALKTSIEKFDVLSKELAEKLEVKPEISHEELEVLKSKVAEGEKAIAELTKIEAEKVLATRLASLAEAGVLFVGEKAETQKSRVATMSDEAFVSYKEDLSTAKQMREEEEKIKTEAEAKAKAEADEKAKVEAEKLAQAKAEAEAAAAVPAKADLKETKEHQEVLNAAQAKNESDELTGRALYASLFKKI